MYKNELYHHGILGQRWGIRRFQRKDGSLTSSGKKRYSDNGDSEHKKSRNKKVAIAAGITAGATIAAASVYLTAKNRKSKAMSVIKEMSDKRGAEIRQNAQRGMEFMNRTMSRQNSAMNSANAAFDVLNRTANKFK